ncbi:hypothetical protein HanXRQr2_Chr04g0167021 [Helianthus annuus]|uniref:Uncharacterized protein n=1 Tax=Helianthus annuus TaxID=4232 RepID=A0A9K3NRB9_HELAN|nr:hypothetical protein HanXRQr2_Chr04g0167021 [Helianthus annuus]KAJ0588896.1 hypothetical protein HanIR_Chr04g0179981 [Helianthus annuus]KAJ0931343.1 hypothetical protein HanPSC8_Chr04g0160561 [Helianthus annuus]
MWWLLKQEKMELETWLDLSLGFSTEEIEPASYWCCWFGAEKMRWSLGTWQSLKKMKLSNALGMHFHYLTLGSWPEHYSCSGSVVAASEAEGHVAAVDNEHLRDEKTEQLLP